MAISDQGQICCKWGILNRDETQILLQDNMSMCKLAEKIAALADERYPGGITPSPVVTGLS
jgi:hypothetical protein